VPRYRYAVIRAEVADSNDQENLEEALDDLGSDGFHLAKAFGHKEQGIWEMLCVMSRIEDAYDDALEDEDDE